MPVRRPLFAPCIALAAWILQGGAGPADAREHRGRERPEADAAAAGDAGKAAPAEASDRLLVTCSVLHAGDGRVFRPGRMLIAGGVIEAVGVDLEAPEGAQLWDLPGAVLTPGLIEPSALVPLGPSEARGGLPAAALSAADARDPWDPWLERLREEGLVAVGLVPAGQGTFRGLAATIGTSGPAAAGAPLLAERAALVVSSESPRPGSAARAEARQALSRELEQTGKYAESWKKWREQEAADAKKSPSELRRDERRRAAKKDTSPRVKKPGRDEGREVLQQVLEHELGLRVHADRAEAVEAALELARGRGLELTLTGCLECAGLAQELARSRAVVLLDPLALPDAEGPRGQADPDLVAALDAAGVRLAVTGGDGWPQGALWLRTAAADLVRRGATPEHALAAMSSEAAAAAGIAATHGRLAKGRAAEFLVWTGDPLRVGSRVERLVRPDETKAAAATPTAAGAPGDEEDRT